MFVEKVKEVLKNLNVIDYIYQAFDSSNIDLNDDNLRRAGFGFHKIGNSFNSSIILLEEIGQYIDNIKKLQQDENVEYPFALLGALQLDDSGNPLIIFNKFVDDNNAIKEKYSSNFNKKMIADINEFLRSDSIVNKVLLLGHTHPVVNIEKDVIPSEKSLIVDSLFNLKNNPLKLRDSGLNISVSDVMQLIQIQENVGRNVMVLQGIMLANGELNIMFYDGSTITSIDNVYQICDNRLVAKQNFRSDTLPTFVKK